jgi:hypothetical protein
VRPTAKVCMCVFKVKGVYFYRAWHSMQLVCAHALLT